MKIHVCISMDNYIRIETFKTYCVYTWCVQIMLPNFSITSLLFKSNVFNTWILSRISTGKSSKLRLEKSSELKISKFWVHKNISFWCMKKLLSYVFFYIFLLDTFVLCCNNIFWLTVCLFISYFLNKQHVSFFLSVIFKRK